MNCMSTFARAVVSAGRMHQAPTLRNYRVTAYKNNKGTHDGRDDDLSDPFSSLVSAYAALPGDGYGASSTVYDCRKFSFCLPDCDPCRVCFEVPKIMPTGIFRFTAGECLGPGAGKCDAYKNPEYYAFHNMSFFDIHLYLSSHRNPVPDSKRKP